MNLNEPFVLKQDVLLIPCAELSDDVRARISFQEGDYTLSLRYGRALAQVIDRETAALLELFREPRTIVDAVFENGLAFDKDPEALLDELLPHLGKFVRNRVLVQPGSDQEKEIRPQHDSGSTIAGWKIVRCASLIEDSEIYQLRNGNDVAALKIARATTPELQAVFDNETAILRHLDGSGIAPRLIDAGVHEERPYLIIDWIAGVDAGVAAAQQRHDRASLIDLCASIVAAYAELHACGVLHADVHARNVLFGEKVMLLDFGYSRFADQPPRVGRAGVSYFFEPEYLAARKQRASMHSTLAGEQYSLAALIYYLLTGHHYLNLRYERDEMERQIEEDPPLPFASRRIPPWPDVEQILVRALEKDPSRRYGSMGEMAALFERARDVTMRESREIPISDVATELLEITLRSLSRGGETFESRYPIAPTASINWGCAGAAMGVLRIAEIRGDPALLALADVWKSRAVALIGSDGAYYNAEIELSQEILHDVTPYHTDSGIHAVTAMVSFAMCDMLSQLRAIEAFLDASKRPCPQIDLTLGRSGSLLATAMLLSISEQLISAKDLRAFGAGTMNAIWDELDARPPIKSSPGETYLGMAHGWAGYFYATMRWCAASGDPLPARLVERLHEYAELKTPKGRGVYWSPKIENHPDGFMPGWCNGSAGQVFLFTLAHRLLGDKCWLELAELSAWNNWDEPRGPSTLCCGSAGRAYALLNLYQHTGATEWLSRARHLANHAAAVAVATSQRTNSLWKGELGVAVLIADLTSPENARMPFFE